MTTAAWLKVPEMTHEEWLMWRKQGIGGSDAPAIMGVSPWATPYQKWEEKVIGKKQGDNASKRFGRDTEAESRREYEDLVGLYMPATNIQNSKESWLRASLDGMSLDGTRLLEIKKANKEDHELALKGKVPDKYYPQCQHILRAHGSAEVLHYFSSPADGSPGKIVEVPRDVHYIEQELIPKEIEFWENVRNKKPPALTERDYISMEKSRKWKAASQKWKENNQLLMQLSKTDKLLRQELISLSKDHNVEGNGLMLSKSIVQGRIDYEAAFDDYVDNLRAHYPEIDFKPISLDPYRKESFVKWTPRVMD